MHLSTQRLSNVSTKLVLLTLLLFFLKDLRSFFVLFYSVFFSPLLLVGFWTSGFGIDERCVSVGS